VCVIIAIVAEEVVELSPVIMQLPVRGSMSTPGLADAFVQSYGQLRSVAARLVPREDADDMVQEAYLRALACRSGFRGESAPTTWIYRILVNRCLDVRRYRQRRGVHVPLGEAHSRPRNRQWHRLIDRRALRAALDSLDSSERQVCVMYDVMGYTHPEIARRLGIPVGTSKGRLCTARRRLRRLLAT
jgi:RNA polymerase sigma-70 factor, ECF subfamily